MNTQPSSPDGIRGETAMRLLRLGSTAAGVRLDCTFTVMLPRLLHCKGVVTTSSVECHS